MVKEETTDQLIQPICDEWENDDFLMAKQRLQRVAERLNISNSVVEMLQRPKRSLVAILPVRMDDGTVKAFWGYRVHHNLSRGPGAGGLRYHAAVNLGSIAAMAMLMTWKSSLMNLPFGGAHGGIRVDPEKLSEGELERLTRRYVCRNDQLYGS